MNCPFLEEVVVRYCNGYPVKKLIPATVFEKTGICHSDFDTCPVFKEWQSSFDRKEEKMEKIEEKLCIWTKIGVVSYRLCTSNYNCQSCEFDQQMSEGKYGESALILQAIERLKSLPAQERVCRYMLTGDLSYKICSNNYECWHCEVDQQIQDRMEYHPAFRRRLARKPEVITIEGIKYAGSRTYTRNHFWLVRTEPERVRVGIDDFAQRLLGEITMIVLTERDTLQFETIHGSVEIPLPTGGKVLTQNEKIFSEPALVNRETYRSWLVEIESSALKQEDLLSDIEAHEWLRKEIEDLKKFSEQQIGATIADGGKLVGDLAKNLEPESWSRLIKQFLLRG
ncbi:MAG TPA: glycine cleavage system protein H [bacterium (Candidatus Stahlbacteria)]|nr:glycine cleavage system protein H [Candidatus Stahlbacteria bacterium]